MDKRYRKKKWDEKKFKKHISLLEIKKTIKNMANNKATGTDKIPTEAYKDMPEEILEHLAKIYNWCLTKNYMPKIWKEGAIFLIYKKRDELDPANYCPIALL